MSELGPTFIVSFDCEGKWGAADHLTPRHHQILTNERLAEAYRTLTDILAAHDLRATFAFVGLLILSPDEQEMCRSWFEGLPAAGRQWASAYEEARRRGTLDGWSAPELLDIVRRGGGHEVGSHGFSHLVIDEAALGRDDLRYELSGLRLLSSVKGLSVTTLVYPRNVKGYVDELPSAGLLGFRDSIPTTGSAAVSFSRELRVFERAEHHASLNRPVAIPGGAFLNWRARLRKRIPVGVTVQRWTSALRNAIETRRVVHLWSHPHNFIDGDSQAELFDRILSVAARYVREGRMENLTQEEYCQRIRGSEVTPPASSAVPA